MNSIKRDRRLNIQAMRLINSTGKSVEATDRLQNITEFKGRTS